MNASDPPVFFQTTIWTEIHSFVQGYSWTVKQTINYLNMVIWKTNIVLF